MNGSGCSSSGVCPTVIVQYSKQSGHAESGSGQAEKLSFVAALWPTPMAGTPAQNGNSAAGNSDFSRRAEALAAGLWATPAATEVRQGLQIRREGMKGSQESLSTQVQVGFLSPLPDRTIAPDGPPFSTWCPISRRLFRSAMSGVSPTFTRRMLRKGGWRKRRLNPAFVEWLMAWPEGHARSGFSGMAFTPWLRLMRGALSRLPSASGPWIWEEAMERETLDLFGGPAE